MLNLTLGLKTNVPSAFSIKDVAGLRVWLQNGAGITQNGDNVSAWADNSGNGNNATQSTETNQPLSSGGGIDLDGTDNFMTLTSVENLTTFTIFAVIDIDDNTLETLFGNGSDGTDFFRLNGSTWTLRTAGSSFQNSLATSAGNDKYLLTLYTERGETATRYYLEDDGTAEANTTIDNQTFNIGDIGRNSANAHYFNGKLYELAIYNVELSASDRQTVEANIMTRNGL